MKNKEAEYERLTFGEFWKEVIEEWVKEGKIKHESKEDGQSEDTDK